MGPIIWKKKHKETQYALRVFPIGGSCMLGEDEDPGEDPREFRNKPVWQRVIVIAAGAILNLVLGFILCIIINSVMQIASMDVARFNPGSVSNTGESALMVDDRIVRINGMTIISSDEVYYKMDNSLANPSRIGRDAALAATVSGFRPNSASSAGENPLLVGDRIIGVNGETVTDASQILNNAEVSPIWEDDDFGYFRLLVIREGEQEPVILENVPFFAVRHECRTAFRDEDGELIRNESDEVLFCGKDRVMFCDKEEETVEGRVCGQLVFDDEGGRAYFRDFDTANDFAVYEFVVIRDGQRVTLDDVRFALRLDNRGEPRVNERGGLSYIRDFRVKEAPKTIPNIMEYSFRDVVGKGRIIWLSLMDILNGTYGINDLSGPVGIAGVVDTVAKQAVDFQQLVMSIVSISAFITVNLGIVNLLPIPALDGARILFLTVEGIRRKPLNQNAEAIIHFVGFALLMLLILVVTFNDVRKLIFGG
jgi:membrane-associated protease RseP (regulator of RpoE activity)